MSRASPEQPVSPVSFPEARLGTTELTQSRHGLLKVGLNDRASSILVHHSRQLGFLANPPKDTQFPQVADRLIHLDRAWRADKERLLARLYAVGVSIYFLGHSACLVLTIGRFFISAWFRAPKIVWFALDRKGFFCETGPARLFRLWVLIIALGV
jgi:hypothetical protein